MSTSLLYQYLFFYLLRTLLLLRAIMLKISVQLYCIPIQIAHTWP